jgi:enoyl-CoA hydratase
VSPSSGSLLEVDRSDGVCLLRLNRPTARNALNAAMAAELHAAIGECSSRDRVVVVTGADPAFCAGIDLKELQHRGIPRLGLAAALHELPTTVIAAVNGPCIAGGLELALASDFIICSERATFGDAHARLGVFPGGGLTARLPRLVGPAYATYLALAGEPIDASTALRMRLVVEVVEHEALLPRCLQIARRIASYEPRVVSSMRTLFADAVSLPEDVAWTNEDAIASDLHASVDLKRPREL